MPRTLIKRSSIADSHGTLKNSNCNIRAFYHSHPTVGSGPRGRVGLSRLQVLTTITSRAAFDRTTLTLGVSRSTIDRNITALRRRLKIILISQKQRKTQLAPINRRVIARTHVVLRRTRTVIRRTSLAHKLGKNRIQITSFHDVTVRLLPNTVTRFDRHCPSVTIGLDRRSSCHRIRGTLQSNHTSVNLAILPTTSSLRA